MSLLLFSVAESPYQGGNLDQVEVFQGAERQAFIHVCIFLAREFMAFRRVSEVSVAPYEV